MPKISELDADASISGSEQVVLNDGGTTKRATVDNVLARIDARINVPTDTEKTTPTDTDVFAIWDSIRKKVTRANIKATLKTYFDTLYVAMTTAQWVSVTGSYASTTTFTYAGTAAEAESIERCLFTCLSSADARKIGYIKSAAESGGTITVTVVSDIDLASGDKTFKIAPHRKIEDYQYFITIPGEQVVDASNPQGMYYRSLVDTYLLPVNSFVRTAAAGSGAACAWNVYKGTTNLFTSAVDLTTNATADDQRPNTNTVSAGDIVTLRVTASAGGTNKASDLQVQLFLVPQTLYTTAA